MLHRLATDKTPIDSAGRTHIIASTAPPTTLGHTVEYFSAQESQILYRIMSARRDMRHFLPNTSIDEVVLTRILQAAHMAPSVGLMQPWRFVRIRNSTLRDQIAMQVENERHLTAKALDTRSTEFLRLKVEGIRECAELIVAILAPDDGTVFGRRTMPEEMALCSVACAIQNMWLAARTENLGLGWVSMFDPIALGHLLEVPPGGKPVAILCIGHVGAFYPAPMLELEGWKMGRPLQEFVFDDTCRNDIPQQ